MDVISLDVEGHGECPDVLVAVVTMAGAVVVKKVEAEEVAQVTVLNSVILPHPNRHQLTPVPHHHSILFLENKLIPRVQVEYSKERTSMFNVVENARTSHTVLHLM